MKNGKIFFKFTFFPSFPDCFARKNANTNVIGIIANVLVSFTVTALSNVSVPKPHMLSQVAAAAVTDDVSLIAVPAKIPKASPDVVENPRSDPKIGNKIAASTLKKKTQHNQLSNYTIKN